MQNDLDDEQWQEFSETERFWVRVTLYKLVYAISGLAVGIACVVVGVTLTLRKLTGFTIGTSSRGELVSATPWAVLFIVGLFVIAITRYSKLSAKQEYDMIERDFAPRLSISHRTSQSAASKRFWKTVNTFTLVYSICGLVSGVGLIISGIVLSLRLITDGAGWAENIVDGILGMMLFGVGLFVITITRYSVKTKDSTLHPLA